MKASYVLWGLLIIIGLSIFGFVSHVISIGANHVTNSMENAVITYDDYQDMYHTCVQLNDNLGVIQQTPENDKQFEQFSKAERENAIKDKINRWVEEYNSKSKHIDKKWWKSSELPYQLSTSDFSNYNKN